VKNYLLVYSWSVTSEVVKRGVPITGRTNRAAKVERKILPKRRLAILALMLSLIGLALFGLTLKYNSSKPTFPMVESGIARPAVATFKVPQSLNELLALSPAELEHCDIARMNLLCAEGLPGTENLNVDDCLATLNQWTRHIKAETDRNYHRFRENPAYYSNSEAFYKMLMMAVVLYEDYGIRYNPRLISSPETIPPDDHFFADSRYIFDSWAGRDTTHGDLQFHAHSLHRTGPATELSVETGQNQRASVHALGRHQRAV